MNWCPEDRSAISDLEVEHEIVDGHLWHIRYPLRDGGHVVVATTRPETMLGGYRRGGASGTMSGYRDLVGGTAVVPGIGREIPVITDPEVDREFGTGAVKITPGHDPNDWRMGQRHGLPVVSILNDDGSLNDEAGQWAGMDRFDGRRAFVAYLESQGLLERVEPHRYALGHCQRDGAVVGAANLPTMVRQRAPPGRPRRASRPRRHAQIPSAARGGRVSALDGDDPALVHLASALAGAPHPGVVLRRLRRDPGRSHRSGCAARPAAATIWPRTRMSSTPGSAQGYGPSRRSAGRTRRPISSGSIPPTSWKPAATSSSSGSRAWSCWESSSPTGCHSTPSISTAWRGTPTDRRSRNRTISPATIRRRSSSPTAPTPSAS